MKREIYFTRTAGRLALILLVAGAVPAFAEGDSVPLVEKGTPISYEASAAKPIPGIKRNNVSVLDMLDYVTHHSQMGYFIDGNGQVIVSPEYKGQRALARRTFSVSNDFYSNLSKAAEKGRDPLDTGSGEFSDPHDSVENLLKKLGVDFPADASATYIEGTGILTVHDTPANLAKVSNVLKKVDASEDSYDYANLDDASTVDAKQQELSTVVINKLKAAKLKEVDMPAGATNEAIEYIRQKAKELKLSPQGEKEIDFILKSAEAKEKAPEKSPTPAPSTETKAPSTEVKTNS